MSIPRGVCPVGSSSGGPVGVRRQADETRAKQERPDDVIERSRRRSRSSQAVYSAGVWLLWKAVALLEYQCSSSSSCYSIGCCHSYWGRTLKVNSKRRLLSVWYSFFHVIVNYRCLRKLREHLSEDGVEFCGKWQNSWDLKMSQSEFLSDGNTLKENYYDRTFAAYFTQQNVSR